MRYNNTIIRYVLQFNINTMNINIKLLWINPYCDLIQSNRLNFNLFSRKSSNYIKIRNVHNFTQLISSFVKNIRTEIPSLMVRFRRICPYTQLVRACKLSSKQEAAKHSESIHGPNAISFSLLLSKESVMYSSWSLAQGFTHNLIEII